MAKKTASLPLQRGEEKPLIFTEETEEYLLDALREQMEAANDPALQARFDGWDTVKLGTEYVKQGNIEALEQLGANQPELKVLCIMVNTFLDLYEKRMLEGPNGRYKGKRGRRKND